MARKTPKSEGLEISKEELQSPNEELSMVHSQLQDKVGESDRVNNDLSNLMAASDIATVFLDTELRIVRFTPPTAKLLNLQATDVGRPFRDLATRFSNDDLLDECQMVLDRQMPMESELRTDENRSFLRRVLPCRTTDNRISGVAITYVDITLLLLSKVFTDSANSIFINDLEGRIIDMNAAAEREYGWPRSELLGKPVKTLVPAEEQSQYDELIQRCVGGGVVRGFETSRLTKSGKALPVLLTLSLLTDHAGRPVGIASISEDISLRKRTETTLREREEMLRAVLDTAADAIITIDQRGIIQSVNPAAAKMFGYSQGELLGQNVKILMPKPYRDEHDGYIARYQETQEARIIGIGRDVIGQRKDGSTFPVGLAVSEVDHLGIYTGIIRDMTKLKETEKHVLEIASEEQRRIGQELHDGTGQELTSISLFAGTLLEMLGTATRREIEGRAVRLFDELDFLRLEQTCQRVVGGLAEANQHVQVLSHGIMPVQVDALGLRSALEELAANVDAQDNVSCHFECSSRLHVPNNTTATHLFRIAQEALNNALRHGQADQIDVSLSQCNGQITLQVKDNGRGFDPDLSLRGKAVGGMGLQIMAYRAGIIGGVLRIERHKKGGMLVECKVFRGG